MRTRIVVTVLAVCGALAFLLWKPNGQRALPAAPEAQEEWQVSEPAELASVSEVVDSVVREAVEQEPVERSVYRHDPVQLDDARWQEIVALREKGGVHSSEDPIEEGACTLFLKLVDAETGAAQKGLVNLWRLNAPGNENWKAGDQLQATVKVLHDGREFEKLPPGSYRAVSMGSASGAGYADVFQVGGARTEHTLLVQAPLEIETFVEIYYASGVRIEEIEVKDAGRSWRATKPSPPPWRVERVAARENVVLQGGGGGGGFGSRAHRSWRKIQAEARGFPFGAFTQNSRERQNRYQFDLRVADGGVVELEIDHLPEPGGRLVAVFMSEQDVLRHVVFSDGRSGEVVEGTKTVKAHTVAIDASHPDATWRDASIEVTVFRDDHRSWKRVWRPSEGPMTDRWVSDK